MRLPRRSVRSITTLSGNQLPSLFTIFPASGHRHTPVPTRSAESSASIEDGIELVPIERQNTTCAKILIPGCEEKEVVNVTHIDSAGSAVATKPLPELPGSRWSRIALKYRIMVVLGAEIALMLLIGLVMFALRGARPHSRQDVEVQSNSSGDPFSVASIAPIRRGVFEVQMANPQQQDSACTARDNDSAVWECIGGVLGMTLLPPPKGGKDSSVSLELIYPSDSTLLGLQPFSLDPVILNPTSDPDSASLGAAYYFRAMYNRTVLFSGHRFTPQGQTANLTENWGQTVAPGTSPWLCAFPDTLIEGYIYVSQNASVNRTLLVGDASKNASTLPYVAKVIERRAVNGSKPFCAQMQMLDNGTLVGLNGEGTKRTLGLTEMESLSHRQENRTIDQEGKKKARQSSSTNDCLCQWMIQ